MVLSKEAGRRHGTSQKSLKKVTTNKTFILP